MGAILLACCAIGALTVAATLRLAPERPNFTSSKIPAIATEEYGKRLFGQTSELLGPDVADPKMHYTFGRLSCGACHLGTGTEPGTLGLPPAYGTIRIFVEAIQLRRSRTASMNVRSARMAVRCQKAARDDRHGCTSVP
jgi:cytochrome c